MPVKRYFLEVMYKGTHYSGFQSQLNTSDTVQAEVEKAFETLQRQGVVLTGSSRTDTHVHALQNFFHFDFEGDINPQFLYKINSILPRDIVVKNIFEVSNEAHCRFDAIARSYDYHIYQNKNPFLEEMAYYFPYALDMQKMREAAALIKEYADFTSFSKRNTQVKTFVCNILESEWTEDKEQIIYRVKANRFLRGMVRGLTGTMLQVGRGKIGIDDLRTIIEAKDCTRADFSVPGHGLFLSEVQYPPGLQLLRVAVL
jgi:tRNA pseudouridine38-40 synthase